MNNLEKYNAAFIESFGISEDQLIGLSYSGIPEWDSIGHMQLVAALENAFGITLNDDDIIHFSSYEKGKECISKYGVEL